MHSAMNWAGMLENAFDNAYIRLNPDLPSFAWPPPLPQVVNIPEYVPEPADEHWNEKISEMLKSNRGDWSMVIETVTHYINNEAYEKYKCQYCQNEHLFASKQTAQNHIRNIHWHQTHPCPKSGCQRVFHTLLSARRHHKIRHANADASPETPWRCEYCEKIYARKDYAQGAHKVKFCKGYKELVKKLESGANN